MNKLYKIIEWTKLKVRINSTEKIKFYFYEREIWWASIGINIGFEQDGKNQKFERPVLIIKKFNSNMLWALPLTTKKKHGDYFFTLINKKNEYTFILPQLRLLSSKRLIRNLDKISEENFKHIKNRIKEIL